MNDQGTDTSPQNDQGDRRDASWADLARDEAAGTSLEWALLLAAVALPGYFTIRLALIALTGHYEMMTTINALPFP